MTQAPLPVPTAAHVSDAASATPTTAVIEQRPQGEFARGSYVWPAWAVLALALTPVLLLVGARIRERLNRKASSK